MSTQSNRLEHETSPYLLQHRDNPVAWWPWGPEALAEAKRTGKPILLSVGYAACHWCHVMAHESFEDPQTAAVMNDLFVNIKVDREERPDLDQIYMAALHHLGEQGGWPLTMFLTPKGEPVWGGTYFPKTARFGRPAFVQVLREVARLFDEEPRRIEQNRHALLQRLGEASRPEGRVTVGPRELDAVAQRIRAAIDPVNGGLRGAPKFPQAAIFELLWRAGLRTGEEGYFDAVMLSLERICQGGIYDHLGGGFSRYAVDERWLVPHFEKMLYDNAQLLDLLALASSVRPAELFRRRAGETVDWLEREMLTPDGGFAASLDADSEGQEGKFYVWSAREIETALGPEEAAFFARFYDVTPGGNFEGPTILNRLEAPDASPEEETRLAALRERLLALRAGRIRPGLDDKVLADWNGLMIRALAHAAIAFARPEWLALAQRTFHFVQKTMTRDARLGHAWRAGRLVLPGLASDHAAMIDAALTLYEATADLRYRTQALAWQDVLDRHYANGSNDAYFLSADDAPDLILRPSATSDDAIANHNAIAAANLVRFAVFTGESRWREKADRLIEGVLAQGGDNLFGHAALLNALDMRLRAAEIVVTGDGPAAKALVARALAVPYTDRVVVRAAAPQALPAGHPVRDAAAPASAAAFVCAGERCSLPVSDPDGLAERLRELRT